MRTAQATIAGKQVIGVTCPLAEAFVAQSRVLGEEAEVVIPTEDFESARLAAKVGFLGFRLEPEREAGRLARVDILIAQRGGWNSRQTSDQIHPIFLSWTVRIRRNASIHMPHPHLHP